MPLPTVSGASRCSTRPAHAPLARCCSGLVPVELVDARAASIPRAVRSGHGSARAPTKTPGRIVRCLCQLRVDLASGGPDPTATSNRPRKESAWDRAVVTDVFPVVAQLAGDSEHSSIGPPCGAASMNIGPVPSSASADAAIGARSRSVASRPAPRGDPRVAAGDPRRGSALLHGESCPRIAAHAPPSWAALAPACRITAAAAVRSRRATGALPANAAGLRSHRRACAHGGARLARPCAHLALGAARGGRRCRRSQPDRGGRGCSAPGPAKACGSPARPHQASPNIRQSWLARTESVVP